ncbi:MAG: hypothetical protein CME02_07200 [Geminicoccus sp.]|nr:hypothetical protein [Geminicoccus sp.]
MSWSELALAEGQQLQTLILPDHYQRLNDGSLVVSSRTGEQLVLSRDQFLELEGGLMLVVDDLAIGAIRQLPLVGTLETHLISDAFPVRSSDGTIIGTQTSSLLRSGEGTAPRLFEEVDIQRYELAQDLSDSSPTMVSVAAAAGVGASGAGGGLLLGLALAGSDTSESETSETVAEQGTGSSTGSLHPYAGQTFLVEFLHPGADKNDGGYGTQPAYIHALDGKLYFSGYDGSEYELYVYDPDTGATAKVDDIHSGADLNSGGSTDPHYMHAFDGKLYFHGRGNDGERELYVYDPDTGATAKVDDIHSGADLNSGGSTGPDYMHAFDGKLYFSGYDGSEAELYVYNPATAATSAVDSADLDSGGSTDPHYMHAFDGKLYFSGYDGTERELYVYNPATAATSKVDSADLNSGGSTDPHYMHAFDGKLYFQGYDGSESELRVYDPDSGTTTKVASADLNSGGSTDPSFLHALDGKLYFQGYDGSESELRVYDPEAGTTTKVASADIDMRDSTYPFDMHALNGQLYFTGTEIADERELYVYFPDDLTV